MRFLAIPILLLATQAAQAKDCMQTVDMSAFKAGVIKTCVAVRPAPATDPTNWCSKEGMRTGKNQGVTLEKVDQCPTNYVAACSMSHAAIKANAAKIPGAQLKTEMKDNQAMVTHYYAAKDVAMFQPSCVQGGGKWTEK